MIGKVFDIATELSETRQLPIAQPKGSWAPMSKPVGEVFAANLQNWLDENDWTQDKLARASGVDVGTIGNWLGSKKFLPTAAHIDAVSAATGMPISALFREEIVEFKQPPPAPPDLEEALDLINSLIADQRGDKWPKLEIIKKRKPQQNPASKKKPKAP